MGLEWAGLSMGIGWKWGGLDRLVLGWPELGKDIFVYIYFVMGMTFRVYIVVCSILPV
jgi:hypothetical protein